MLIALVRISIKLQYVLYSIIGLRFVSLLISYILRIMVRSIGYVYKSAISGRIHQCAREAIGIMALRHGADGPGNVFRRTNSNCDFAQSDCAGYGHETLT